MNTKPRSMHCTMPNRLINYLQEHFDVMRDSRLSAHLGLAQSVIYGIRYDSVISAFHILRIHDVTGLSVDRIRDLAGVQYSKGRIPKKLDTPPESIQTEVMPQCITPPE